MKTIFIRHKLSANDEILEDLWAKRKIAVHYANIRSTNPSDYQKSGEKFLSRFWEYCNNGAIVGATYRKIRPAHMLLGVLEKGSLIEWTDEYGDDYIYKTAQLTKPKIISFHDYPLLSAIRPRGGTITGWTSAQKYLQALLENDKIPFEVKSLAPSQVEVICYEYLKIKGIIKALLLPIGRGLPDIDIFGLNNSGE
ncbi:MAG: hypothetical protein K8R77_14865, partial [Anaerolineaceae bacterium]|nr:hypothetical protein [Anaerolineaceae bacterium]